MVVVDDDEESILQRRARIGFGIANLCVALFIALGVFRLLPTRWWLVDSGALIMILLLGGSGVTLLRKHRLRERITRIAAAVVLVLGLALFAAIAITASWISGVYQQVGASGAIVFGLVAALVLPYVVVLPAVELAWVGPRASAPPQKAPAAAAAPEPKEDEPKKDHAPPPSKKKKKKR
jgi:hypothetical protein